MQFSELDKIFLSFTFFSFGAISLVSSFLSGFCWIHFQEGLDGLSVTLGIAAATGLGLLAYTEVIPD